MLYKYNCKIKPLLDSALFTYFEDALTRHRILDKWFYFYIHDAFKPVVIWKIENSNTSNWHLHPGTNRYIGTALRNNNEWIDGILITDTSVDSREIKILDKIDYLDWNGYDLEFDKKMPCNDLQNWAIGSQMSDDPFWFCDVYKWITNNVKDRWGLEYQGTIHYVSPGEHHIQIFGKKYYLSFRRTKTIIKASDYPDLKTAVKTLFEMIKESQQISQG
jgi:hypothetical protein